MSAQSSSMHKIMGPARSAFGRMAGTSRSFVAAARLHPAGFAVPSAVIVVAIAFVTFVTAVVLRVIPPNLFGMGSPPIIQPSTSQPRHRPHQQPVVAGPPMLRPWGGSRGLGSIRSHGQGPGSDEASSLPTTLSTIPTLPITSLPRLTAGDNPTSISPATAPTIVSVTVGTSGSVTQVSQTATPVVRTTTTTLGQAVQGVTGTAAGTVGAVTGTVGAVTGTVGAVTGTVGAVTSTVGAVTSTVGAVTSTVGAVTSTVGAVTGTVGAVTNTVAVAAPAAQSAAPVSAQVSVGSSGSAAGGSADPASVSAQTPTVTATVTLSDPAGNGSPQPAVSLLVSVPGLG
jgi:hypothetical protein